MPLEIPTPEEAERAIYIDFEGTAVDPPSLLGVLWADDADLWFDQYVVEEALWPAAIAKSAAVEGHCLVSTWDDLAEVRARAEEEGRLVYAWSQHEHDELVGPGLPDEDRAWFEEHVWNAIPLAKRWKRKTHPNLTFKASPKNPKGGGNRLQDYLELIEYAMPKAFGPGNSAQRIRATRDMLLAKGGDYEALTPVVKAKWSKALTHNWHDCNGMRQIVLRCASELP